MTVAASVDPGTTSKVTNMSSGGAGNVAPPAPEAAKPAAPVVTAAPAAVEEVAEVVAAAAAEDVDVAKAASTEAEKAARFERAKRIAERERKKTEERIALQRTAQRAQWEAQQAQAAITKEREERARLEREFAAFRSDPMAHLEKMGVKAEDIARRALEDNTPEAKLARLEASVLEKQAAFEKRVQEQEQREAAARYQANIQQARATFVRECASDRYPTLSRIAAVDAPSLVREAESILSEALKQTGHQYSDDEVRDFLESKYSRFLSPSEQKQGTGESAATAAASETSTGPGQQAKTRAGTPRTLTDKANQRGTAPSSSLDDLSDREQRRVMAEMYRAKRRSG